MGKDVTAFRKRFEAYKNGKSVSEIYDAGLPRYAEGTPSEINPYTEQLLKRFEGFSDSVYLDGKGIPTIGYGFTDSSWVDKGKVSRKEADVELKRIASNVQKTLIGKLGADNWAKMSPEAQAALVSYAYNYPAGFKDTTNFMKLWRAGKYWDAISEVDAGMNDKANRGLRTRRLEEQALLKKDPFFIATQSTKIDPKNIQINVPIVQQSDVTQVRQTIPAEQTRARWEGAENVSPYLTGKPQLILRPEINIPNIKDPIQKYESWFEKRPLLSYVMSQDEQPEDDGLLYAKNSKLPGYKNGKSPIHIKPANRGKFTALKKRTGHSASWFKENGTPAQKKMAVFALNAKKWHHADGKLPEYGGGLTPVAMPAQAAQNNNVVNGIMSYIPFVGTAMDGNDLIQGDARAAIPFLIGTVADTVGGRSLYKAYQARKIFMDAVKQKLSTSQVYPLMIQANDKMNKALAGAAAYASDWYENTLQNLRK